MQALEEATDTYLIEKKGSEEATVSQVDGKGITTVGEIEGDLYVTNITKYDGIKVEVTSDFTIKSQVGSTSNGR